MKLKIFAVRNEPISIDTVLLLIRLFGGYAFMMHGWGKIQNPMGWMGDNASIPALFQALAAISEFGGGLAWILGLVTPLASFGIACTMAVAAYMHAVVFGDPIIASGPGGSAEPATNYLLIALLLMVMKAGRFSLDRMIFGKR